MGFSDVRPRPSDRPTLGLTRSGLVIAGLAGLFLLTVLIVGPNGDFPLNDDWSFVRSTRALALTGDWRPLGWAAMTLVSHAVVGALVCSVASCSFEHLRLVSLCGALALLLVFAAAARARGAPPQAGVLGAVAVVFNPLLYPLAFTFMTEVVFALLTLLAAVACVAALRTARWRHVLLSTVLLVAATLSRQLAIGPAAAFLPVYLLSSREPPAARWAKAALPVAASASALLLYESWMRRTGRLPDLYDGNYGTLIAGLSSPGHAVATVVTNLLVAGLYLGLIGLPVLLLQSPRGEGSGLSRAGLRWATVVTVAALAAMASNHRMMPLLGNVFGESGTGPLTLRDSYVLGLANVPALPAPFWAAVTAFSLLGLWLLGYRVTVLVTDGWRDARAEGLAPSGAAGLFGILATLLYLLPLLPGGLYDRYLAVIAPVLFLGILPSTPVRPGGVARPALLAAGGCAALAAVVSVLSTHDYMAWNRARWAAIADVEAAHEADAATLDGGFEYNASRSYDPHAVPDPSKSWWWVADDAVQIAFGPIPGTALLRRYPYANWLPPEARSISVLRRLDPPAAASVRTGPGAGGPTPP